MPRVRTGERKVYKIFYPRVHRQHRRLHFPFHPADVPRQLAHQNQSFLVRRFDDRVDFGLSAAGSFRFASGFIVPVKKIGAELPPAEVATGPQNPGREYRSRFQLLGLPFFHLRIGGWQNAVP